MLRIAFGLLLGASLVASVVAQEQATPFIRMNAVDGNKVVIPPDETEDPDYPEFTVSYDDFDSVTFSVGEEVNIAPSVTGVSASSLQWVALTPLMPGLTLDPATGVISGTTLVSGHTTIRIAAVDGGNHQQVSPSFAVVFLGSFDVYANETDYYTQVGAPEAGSFEFIASANDSPIAVIGGETVHDSYAIVNSNVPGISNGSLADSSYLMEAPSLSTAPGDYSFQFARTSPYGTMGYSPVVNVHILEQPRFEFPAIVADTYSIETQPSGRPLIKVLRDSEVVVLGLALNDAGWSNPDYELEWPNFIPSQAAMPPGFEIHPSGGLAGNTTIAAGSRYDGIVIPNMTWGTYATAYGWTIVDVLVVDSL